MPRPTVGRMQGRGALQAVVAGVGAAVLATALTWGYLSSITIDDGLEGLVFLPLLAVACGIVSVPVGWRHTSIAGPATIAGVAVATATVVLAAHGASRGGPPLASTVVVGAVVLGPLALSRRDRGLGVR